MFKRFLPYLFHIILAATAIVAAYFLLKPHYKTTGLTIGLVNMQRVRSQAEPFQQLSKQVSQAHTQAQEHFQSLEKSLRKEYEELQSLEQKKHTKTEVLANRKAAIDKKVAEFELQVQQEREVMKQKFEHIHLTIEAELEKIIREFSKKNKINLLLNTSNNEQEVALVADDSLNHTDAIIDRLNKNLPNIQELKK
jgi:Skp family chaperone for outer membrane proteins